MEEEIEKGPELSNKERLLGLVKELGYDEGTLLNAAGNVVEIVDKENPLACIKGDIAGMLLFASQRRPDTNYDMDICDAYIQHLDDAYSYADNMSSSEPFFNGIAKKINDLINDELDHFQM